MLGSASLLAERGSGDALIIARATRWRAPGPRTVRYYCRDAADAASMEMRWSHIQYGRTAGKIKLQPLIDCGRKKDQNSNLNLIFFYKRVRITNMRP
jgi:hypothetical protein